ncbi:YrzI family small protein [Bacillus aerolatus]|uniref:YrzI family small protein n=1 Tax=Bacillus aerolatus TaxID=2653354 RepID=A0A6I1FJ36_9BACI|nr:YrzI family small protein [Bacillus aerolatus]KAB7706234.1 YrzI family small protein [Bacillus aerolatus]
MTINLIFVIITIKKRKKSVEDYFHNERVKKMYEEMHMKQQEHLRNFF